MTLQAVIATGLILLISSTIDAQSIDEYYHLWGGNNLHYQEINKGHLQLYKDSLDVELFLALKNNLDRNVGLPRKTFLVEFGDTLDTKDKSIWMITNRVYHKGGAFILQYKVPNLNTHLSLIIFCNKILLQINPDRNAETISFTSVIDVPRVSQFSTTRIRPVRTDSLDL